MPKIGVQTIILRKSFAENGIYNTLKKLKETGFSCIEVSMVEMTEENVAEIARASKDLDIEIAALSTAGSPMGADINNLFPDFDKYVADCKTLNCKYLRIGMVPIPFLSSMETCYEYAKKCEEYAVKFAEQGIKLFYHNHHVEFIQYEGKYLLEIFRDMTKVIGFELDTHWIQRGGENPVDFVKTFKDRIDLFHIKDYKVVAPDFSGVEKGDMKGFMGAFNNVIKFAEVGEGSLNFPEIIKNAIDCGAKYIFIEQDDPYEKDAFECLAISRANLVKMGYGDLI